MKLNHRNKLLILGVVLMLIASYKMALSKTVLLYGEYKNLDSKEQKAHNLPKKIAFLMQKDRYYDSLMMTTNLISDTSIQNHLLRLLNREAKAQKVNLVDFDPPHIQTLDNTTYHTYRFKLRGPYTRVLQVIHGVEQKGNIGDIVHLNFEKEEDYRKRKIYLEATVFVRHME